MWDRRARPFPYTSLRTRVAGQAQRWGPAMVTGAGFIAGVAMGSTSTPSQKASASRSRPPRLPARSRPRSNATFMAIPGAILPACPRAPDAETRLPGATDDTRYGEAARPPKASSRTPCR